MELKKGQGIKYLRQWIANGSKRIHVEKRKGTGEQAANYCKKEATRVKMWKEYGEQVATGGKGQRTDIKAAIKMIKEGSNERKLIEEGVSNASNYKFLQNALKLMEKQRDWKTEVRWYWGGAGTGKTKTAREEAGEDCYVIKKTNGGNTVWWDGYDGHENVIMDDFRPNTMGFSELLRLLDRYPKRIQVKGGMRQFLAKTIWITTPLDPIETCKDYIGEDLKQLLRRIDVIKKFE